MNSIQIRQKYLDYFARRGHKIVPSDSLIPSSDPTLLFTSAGMVQFKKHFLGQSNDAFSRATSCQKCFRTSDIEQVGLTNRHLTFFEMLGNFSFGDYFKQDAVAWAWEFLTVEMHLPPEKLTITIYKNDDEAAGLWKKTAPRAAVIRLGDETNFWNMGPTGPCGPCSEILLDLGESMGCGKPDCGPACSCNRYLEIWNLVFTQFDRQENGELKPLPRKNIDTGMGLERLVAAASGKSNVFDTDLFVSLIDDIAGLLDREKAGNLPQLRMMADHARAITFLISDGVLPSNEGRGYVLRRILRRASRQGKLFGYTAPFLYQVTGRVIEIMKSAYPELEERRERIAAITRMEEEKFLETVEAGTKILEELIDRCKTGQAVLPGEDVFRLYDTYGFPFDLTREIARERGLSIDEEGFRAAQRHAQEKSRAAWSGSGDKDVTLYAALQKEVGASDFRGYECLSIETDVTAVLKDGTNVGALAAGQDGEVVLRQTPFYAESGGQVGDTGILVADGVHAEVRNTQKPAGELFVHAVHVRQGEIRAGMRLTASVDEERRRAITRHHTATHLLHKALRTVLGTHVTQAGSLVTPDHFRFDFTHLAALKPEETESAETMVNEAIRQNMEVHIATMKIDEARRAGAMALFGEKYGDTVRMVSVQPSGDRPPYSMELCGGAHVTRTGDIGLFKIIAESSVAAGTRRIEAVAGRAAERYVRSIEQTLETIAGRLKVPPAEIAVRIDKLLARQRDMERECARLKTQIATGGSSGLMNNVREIGGVKLLAAKVFDFDVKSLRDLADNLQDKLRPGIVVLANIENGRVSFVVNIGNDLVKTGYHAGNIARKFSSLINGSGGGKPDFAQGGGKDVSLIDAAFSKLPDLLK